MAAMFGKKLVATWIKYDFTWLDIPQVDLVSLTAATLRSSLLILQWLPCTLSIVANSYLQNGCIDLFVWCTIGNGIALSNSKQISFACNMPLPSTFICVPLVKAVVLSKLANAGIQSYTESFTFVYITLTYICDYVNDFNVLSRF